ncbi:hypothetical protein [Allofournierella sp.]|uniref:hypothetical protein n=1 Tax=Allofournierella sp. TaxID=1940256 RepID=UPI002E783963|nr:hypothetical protein [Fournierella sp.]MEE0755627.1 hypothetical protein [Fournierella sp.]
MSGRRIRRPPGGTAAPARAPRQKDKARRVQRQVLATGAAILLAGTAATFLLEQAVLAPRRQVQTESALPVYSAVGQRTDDVSFWPWTFYAEQAGQTPTLFPMEGDTYTAEMLVTLIDALLGGGVEMETSSAVIESYSDARSSCQYLRDLPVLWRPPDGGEAQNLVLNMAYGNGSDPALTFGMAVSFVVKPADQTPTEAQLEAAYRQVLLDLYFQCGAAGWLLDDAAASEIMEATPAPVDAPSDLGGETASQPAQTDGALSDEAVRRLQSAAQMPLETMLDRLSGPMTELVGLEDFILQWPAGLGPDTALWPVENSPDPAALAAGTLSEEDTHKLEQRLQQQYAEYGMELQVVTLSDSVLVLFSSNATLGFYYDPVLEVWSGFAVQ